MIYPPRFFRLMFSGYLAVDGIALRTPPPPFARISVSPFNFFCALVVLFFVAAAAEAGMEVDRASVQQLAIGYKREPIDPFNFILSLHFVKVGRPSALLAAAMLTPRPFSASVQQLCFICWPSAEVRRRLMPTSMHANKHTFVFDSPVYPRLAFYVPFRLVWCGSIPHAQYLRLPINPRVYPVSLRGCGRLGIQFLLIGPSIPLWRTSCLFIQSLLEN